MFDTSWCYFDFIHDPINETSIKNDDVNPKMHHLASLTTPPKPARFDHSSRLSERKRALFPSHIHDSSDDSDIGHMSPLEYSSSPEPLRHQNSPESNGTKRYFGFDQTNTRPERFSSALEPIQDSDESNDVILKGRFSPDIVQFHRQNQENIDPKYSPKCSPKKHPKTVTFEDDDAAAPKSPDMSDTIIPGTPVMSPTEILKTPHDSSNNTNQKVPRLVRKSLIDITNIDTINLKRKSESPIESPANKSFKFEQHHHHQLKTSKARTALFPESIFPAKSFYPKIELKTAPVHHVDVTQKTKRKSSKNTSIYLCNRSRNQHTKKNFVGQINAGVRHKIKKPRLKPALSKTQLLKAALNIVKNSPLNEYFDAFEQNASVCSENECGVSFEQIQKMDLILKNLDVKSIQPQEKKPNLIEGEPKNCGTKRCRSPQPDQTKKFFKTGHANKATITITNNIKFQLDHGEMSLIEKQNKIRRTSSKREIIQYDPNDFSLNEEDTPQIIDNSFSEIFKALETTTTPPLLQSTITAQNNSSIMASENQKQLHSVCSSIPPQLNTNMLLSPTSLVCDLTSGLALDSPKNQPIPSSSSSSLTLDKLSTLKKRISFPENMDTQKLFPIFYGAKQNDPKPSSIVVGKESKHVKNIRKIWKPLSEDQTLIDAGQKKFGLTQCPECKCVYSLGEPEDEIMHFQHHNSVSVLRYNCWKHERVVNHFANGKVIQVNPNDPKPWLKKVKDLLEVVNRELGFVDVPFHMINQKVFLCIMNKQIVGCLVAEPKMHAHKMLPNENTIDQCTEETYPIKCGVSRLWVAVTHRNKGVGTCLMNAMRSNFMYGHILSMHEIAFSAPTEAGKKFASKYTKTEEFLIYTS